VQGLLTASCFPSGRLFHIFLLLNYKELYNLSVDSTRSLKKNVKGGLIVVKRYAVYTILQHLNHYIIKVSQIALDDGGRWITCNTEKHL
jgi:hypothetical protein